MTSRESTLQREVVGPWLTLLLCERAPRADDDRGRDARLVDLLRVRRLVTSDASAGAGDDLIAEGSVAFERLGVRDSAVYLVRPDGYVAYRCAGTELRGVEQWLEKLESRGQTP